MSWHLVLLHVALFAAAGSAPDSRPRDGSPRGTVTRHSFKSRIFPGTERDYWIYVPAQYSPSSPACVMVFQDGKLFVREDAPWHVPAVFDDLIHAGEMPVTIGLFINHGVIPAAHAGALARHNRSFEYDSVGDRYARFLIEEMLPEVARSYRLSPDPGCRAIAGSSSGAIAAFSVAWERPDAFGRVFSTIGTYVGLRGGDAYPALIRKSEPRPIRIFLHDGTNDLDAYGGNWWFANQAMFAALQFAGYEVNHAWGEGGHDSNHAASIFRDALRWLWKGFPGPIVAGAGSKQPLMDVLMPDETWQLVGEGFDGRKRIVAFDRTGRETVRAARIEAFDLAAAHDGSVYATDRAHGRVWLVRKGGARRVVDDEITLPTGVALAPDQSQLYVADGGRFVHVYQIQGDGSLAHKQPYCHLHVPENQPESGAVGIAVDSLGGLYVSTHLGIQLCDPSGRVQGIIAKPQGEEVARIAFGGSRLQELYALVGGKVWKRKTRVSGVSSSRAPVTPPAPRP